jgi:hypothetical protein
MFCPIFFRLQKALKAEQDKEEGNEVKSENDLSENKEDSLPAPETGNATLPVKAEVKTEAAEVKEATEQKSEVPT